MTTIYRSFSHVIPFFIVGTIVLALLIAIVNFSKIRNKTIVWEKTIVTLLLSMWILGVSLITILPTSWGLPVERALSLLPFQEFTSGFGVGNSNLKEFVANFAMFSAGGLICRLRFEVTATKTALYGLVFGVFIEIMQYIIGAGRVTSVTDLILAFCGSFAGALIAKGAFLDRSSKKDQFV